MKMRFGKWAGKCLMTGFNNRLQQQALTTEMQCAAAGRAAGLADSRCICPREGAGNPLIAVLLIAISLPRCRTAT
jgi:hypothetical protein